MMKKYILFLQCCCLTILALGQTKQVITKFAITYNVKHMGFSSTGKFDKLTGDIHFDADHLNTSIIIATIETNSFDSDNSMRDKDLKSDSYFDVAQYPKIFMKSVSFMHTAGDNYTGQFDLTIKGKTKRMQIPFTYTLKGTTGKFEANFAINRVDYNVGGSSMMLANNVTISIEIETILSK